MRGMDPDIQIIGDSSLIHEITSKSKVERIKEKRGFEGKLFDMQLTDIIQMNCLGRVTTSLFITNDGHRGVVYFKDGEIIHAECDDIAGEEAFYIILEWQEGKFVSNTGVVHPRETISLPWEHLLMEGIKRKDEAGGVSGEIEKVEEPSGEEILTSHVDRAFAYLEGEGQKEELETAEPVLPEGLGLLGLGTVDQKLAAVFDPQSVLSEQFRKMRTVLSQLLKENDFSTIMVTSTRPQEGKTITACSLGVVITQGFHDKAFLIDCDLRKPSVHHLFGLNGQPGLAELLSGKKKLSQVIHEINGLKLKILPAGRSPESPGELLSSDKMVNLLQELKIKFQDSYIILDTTPVLSKAETGLLSSIVDGIILVIMAGKTSRDVVKRAIKEIPNEKVIGIVFNYAQSKKGYNFKHYDRYYHR